ncbi:MAG: GNAT family N-acetyltransferase [Spirochaetales bacterium]|nr:GNAT family N-acetyltransferase [Spirochaetales bacterium]
MNIEIKENNNTDIIARINKTVQDLHTGAYPEYFKQYDYKAVRQGVADMLADKHWHSFIAYADDIPVGYLLCFIREYTENPFRCAYRGLHIDQMCVLEDYQRHNIGSMLMARAEEFAAELKLDHIELTFWDKNIHAKNFYQKYGFGEAMHFVIKKIKR